MSFIGWIWDFLRDAAILAAAVGLAKWSWDQHKAGGERRDNEARRAIEESRAWSEQKAYQDAMLAMARSKEERAQLKLRIHRLMHASRDPFLTFAEIRDGLAEGGHSSPTDETLRRAVIELVAERVLAQMEGDRYFVAGDYEAEDEQESPA